METRSRQTLTDSNVRSTRLYNLTLASYVLAGGHFLSELFIFKSAGLQGPALSPVLVASKRTSACGI